MSSCSGKDDGLDKFASDIVCAVGETNACVGIAGCTGGQTCRADRSGWNECDCGGAMAGTGGAKDTPVDSTGGATGSGGATTLPNGSGGTGGQGSLGGAPNEGIDITPEQVDAITKATCTTWTAEAYSKPTSLEFVVDVSGSMNAPAPGTNDLKSKWDVTQAALSEAISSLSPSVLVGMLLYPNKVSTLSETIKPVDSCIYTDKLVDLAPLLGPMSQQRAALSDALDFVEPEFFTPTHDAYAYALDKGLKPKGAGTRRFMILLTDGAPTASLGCSSINGRDTKPTQPIVDAIKNAQKEGISTFVIGLPGSEVDVDSNNLRPWLSDAAIAGGTDPTGCSSSGPNYCHMDMSASSDFSADLKAGLASISGQVIDECTFELPEPPQGELIDLNKSQLIVTRGDGTTILLPADKEGECDNGWQFNSNGDALLCSDTCELLTLDSQASVQLSFGCEASEIDSITTP